MTSKPARRKASSVTKRCVPWALAGVATTVTSRSSSLAAERGRLERVRTASRSETRKRAISSPPVRVVPPICTSKSGAARGPERRRLNERSTVHSGSAATASASKPKRSSPRRSAATEGYQSIGLPPSSWKVTTG